ncbi:MAG: hypothetical protein AAF465_14550 [Pseudomonadota bacterium]
MHSVTKNITTIACTAAALILTATASAQEVVMVYAANIATTNTLSDVQTTLTPSVLAASFADELRADMAQRLPQEYTDLAEARRLQQGINTSILSELDERLRDEINRLTAHVAR